MQSSINSGLAQAASAITELRSLRRLATLSLVQARARCVGISSFGGL
jgi:hypothetical protein